MKSTNQECAVISSAAPQRLTFSPPESPQVPSLSSPPPPPRSRPPHPRCYFSPNGPIIGRLLPRPPVPGSFPLGRENKKKTSAPQQRPGAALAPAHSAAVPVISESTSKRGSAGERRGRVARSCPAWSLCRAARALAPSLRHIRLARKLEQRARSSLCIQFSTCASAVARRAQTPPTPRPPLIACIYTYTYVVQCIVCSRADLVRCGVFASAESESLMFIDGRLFGARAWEFGAVEWAIYASVWAASFLSFIAFLGCARDSGWWGRFFFVLYWLEWRIWRF